MLAPRDNRVSSKFYGICSNVNQAIYTLDTICKPNIMILAQAVLQIICSQGPLGVKCRSLKRGTLQSSIHIIVWTSNQVIYIMYPNFMPDTVYQLEQFTRYTRQQQQQQQQKKKKKKTHTVQYSLQTYTDRQKLPVREFNVFSICPPLRLHPDQMYWILVHVKLTPYAKKH